MATQRETKVVNTSGPVRVLESATSDDRVKALQECLREETKLRLDYQQQAFRASAWVASLTDQLAEANTARVEAEKALDRLMTEGKC